MKFLRNILDDLHPQFTDGGKYEKLYPLYEALDTFAFTPGEVSTGSTHVRDSMDMKRLMVTVVIALIPVTLMGIWNAPGGTECQHYREAEGRSAGRVQ